MNLLSDELHISRTFGKIAVVLYDYETSFLALRRRVINV
jgi:hypothetical protein